jgi:hypothetical protein
MEMKPKDLCRRAALLHRLPPPTLKKEVWWKEEAHRWLDFLKYLHSKKCVKGAYCCQGIRTSDVWITRLVSLLCLLYPSFFIYVSSRPLDVK